jgi:hypothetical protein
MINFILIRKVFFLVIEFKRESYWKTTKKKVVSFRDSDNQNSQALCQMILLDERSSMMVILSSKHGRKRRSSLNLCFGIQ